MDRFLIISINFEGANMVRGINKHSVGGGKFGEPHKKNLPPPPFLEKYHDVYQIIGFSWV